jgi:hypothetical protein
MEMLLREMQTRARSHLLFPSDMDVNQPLPYLLTEWVCRGPCGGNKGFMDSI